MKSIALTKHYTLLLPEEWTEVEMKHREKVFSTFIGMLLGQMTLFDWQLRTLCLLSGYKPSRATRRAIVHSKPVDNIAFNMIQLASLLDFPFEKQEDNATDTGEAEEQPLRLRCDMPAAPFPCRIYFNRTTPFIETNLTAGEFVQAVELLQLINEPGQQAPYVEQLMKKVAELVGAERTDSLTQKDCIACFNSTELDNSPRNGILYNAKPAGNKESVIAKGAPLTDTLLEMQERGYNDPKNMPVEEYHEAQLKILRDNLQRAVHEGVKPEELSLKTGVPVDFFA